MLPRRKYLISLGSQIAAFLYCAATNVFARERDIGPAGATASPAVSTEFLIFQNIDEMLNAEVYSPKLALLLGFVRAGDGGGGSYWWVANFNLEAKGQVAFRSKKTGSWVRIGDHQQINVMWFGADSTGTNDSSGAILKAIEVAIEKGGGSIFFPAGKYRVDRTIEILGNNVKLVGVGRASCISLSASGRIIFGKRHVNEGRRSGTKVIFCELNSIAFQCDSTYKQELISLDYTDNFTVDNVSITISDSVGQNKIDGIRCYWTQYTTFKNYHSFVNGHAVSIYLDSVHPQNDDHFSFYSCFLYSSKRLKLNEYSANIFVERAEGRNSAIGHFSAYACHFAAFTTNNEISRTRGVLAANSDAQLGTRLFEQALFVDCMFENAEVFVDFSDKCKIDNSRLLFISCYFLGNNRSLQCFRGGNNRTVFATQFSYFLNVSSVSDGAEIVNLGMTHGKNVSGLDRLRP